MRLFVLCLFLGAVAAEAPFAGYAPSGWRPQGAQFRLPTEYGAPIVEQKEDVQITKEKVAFAAQVVESTVETTTEQILSNEYLPPTTTEQPELDPIRVQGLPENQFRDFQKQTQPSIAVNGQLRLSPSRNIQFGRQQQAKPVRTYGAPEQDDNDSDIQNFPENHQDRQLPLFQQNGQLRANPAKNVQFSRQEQPQPAQTYGVPDQDDSNLPEEQYKDAQQSFGANQASQQPFIALSGQLRAFPVNNFKFGRQEQAQPTQTYGAPADKDGEESSNEDLPEDPEPTEVPSSDNDEAGDQDEQTPNDGRTVIAVANSFAGQYYVLGPDNNLQRVMYATSQSDDDRRNMGFTAQLRYSQVEPIRGPVYAYNEQGQLVRIYK